jgi:hypothetical protein
MTLAVRREERPPPWPVWQKEGPFRHNWLHSKPRRGSGKGSWETVMKTILISATVVILLTSTGNPFRTHMLTTKTYNSLLVDNQYSRVKFQGKQTVTSGQRQVARDIIYFLSMLERNGYWDHTFIKKSKSCVLTITHTLNKVLEGLCQFPRLLKRRQ